MTYSDNLLNEGINSQFLAILSPRRLVDSTGWALISGTYYKQEFDYGLVTKLEIGGSEETKATSLTLSDGTWFYDVNDKLLYVDIGSNPANSDIIATYRIFISTFDAHWYSDPLDATSFTVYYEPIIVKSPSISQNTSDSLFGFYPTTANNLIVSNLTHILEQHVYDSSFNNSEIVIYHQLGQLEVDNLKEIFSGLVSNITYGDERINFKIFDNTQIFESEYRNPSGPNFYNDTDWPNIDPNYINRPIRNCYGVTQGVIPVNLDYEDENPTYNDNRVWTLGWYDNSVAPGGVINRNVPASPVSTTTRTYVTDATGFQIGDNVKIANPSSSDEFQTITAVNTTSNYIDHTLAVNTADSFSVVTRYSIGSIYIFKDEILYKPQIGKDLSLSVDLTNKILKFTFLSSMEASVGILTPINPYDLVYCKVYGRTNSVTLGGSDFGGESDITQNLTNPVAIMLDLMKQIGISENSIDATSFNSLVSSVTDECGFMIPRRSFEEFPTYKSIINDILTTTLVKLFLDDENKWSIYQTGPLGSYDKIIEDDEILKRAVNYNFKYSDTLSKVFVEYAFREVSEKHEKADTVSRVSSSSSATENLHKFTRQKTYKSLHFIDSEAEKLSDRIGYALSDRVGELNIKTKNRFFNTSIGDVIRVSRDKLPGFEFERDTNRFRDFIVLSVLKSLNQIDIKLEDQKGIEDNSSSW